MRSAAQTIRVGKKEFVLVPASEYERLRRLATGSEQDAVAFGRRSIGRDLVRKRMAAGLSQSEVAARARIRAETLSRLENGHGNPTIATVRKILRALGERE
jgi:DNA-binding XRE family transcriptional regulator